MKSFISGIGQTIHTSALKTALHQGQIQSGKVTDMLPDNQVMIQMGHQKVKAQVDSPLQKEKSYIFQVESVGDLVHLKVVSQKGGSSVRGNITQMLQRLSLPVLKPSVDLAGQLMKKEIPFKAVDLKQALTILEGAVNKPLAKEILLDMIQRQLPVNKSIFDSLMVKRSTDLSQLFQSLETDQKTSSLPDQKLANLLTQLKGVSSAISPAESSVIRLMTEVTKGDPSSFNLFKKAGLIEAEADFSRFQQTWNRWADTNKSPQSSLSAPLEQWGKRMRQSSAPLPGPLSEMKAALMKMFDQQLVLTKQEQQTLTRWVSQLDRLLNRITSNDPVREATKQTFLKDHQWLMENQTFQKINGRTGEGNPALPQSSLKDITRLVEQPAPAIVRQGREVLQAVRTVQNNQLTQAEKAVLTEWVSRLAANMNPDTKESIFIKMRAMLDLSGIQDEATMRNLPPQEVTAKEPSLKSVLLQGLQDTSTSIKPDAARQMIQFLNGIQLSSYQETNQTLQIALQFPGELLGSREDIHMNMEGQKTKDGEIDPNFCHIVFFLSLEHLKETVIHLNIVNRRVSVTVFNETEKMDTIVDKYKPSLKDRLDEMGYQLQSVQVKWMDAPASSPRDHDSEKQEGVDIRI